MIFWNFSILGATLAFAFCFKVSFFFLATKNFLDLTFLLASRVPMTPWYFHPTSWASRFKSQNLLFCLSRRTLRAAGTTNLFLLSYGGGTPSNTFSLLRASLPLWVVWGIIPLTAL